MHLSYDLDLPSRSFIPDARAALGASPLGLSVPAKTPSRRAHRETMEESGLEIELLGPRPPKDFPGTKILTAPSYLDVHDIHGDHRHIGMIYFARAGSAELRLAEEEHHAIRRWL